MDHQTDDSPGLEWAKRVLELELPDDLNLEQLKGAGLDSFFRGLDESDYFPNPKKSAAVEVLLGKSPNLSREYNLSIERQHLQTIDAIVKQYSSQLGLVSLESAQEKLRSQLSPYRSQTSLAAVRFYAEQVQLAAGVTESPLDESNSLARTLAQAVFHIAAIRSSQRRIVRTEWVNRLKDSHPLGDLQVAATIVETQYRIPNHKFHQPFLQLVRWPEEQTELFQIAVPVSSDTRSVVAYSKDFGRTHQPAPPASTSTNWGWLIFAIVFGLLVAGIGRSQNSTTPKPKAFPFVELPLNATNRIDPPGEPEIDSPEGKYLKAIELLLRRDQDSQGGSNE